MNRSTSQGSSRKKKTAKRSLKQARQSTTRSTAGPGFDFEDQIGAWLLLKTLAGQPIPVIGGTGIRLQMQVEALGWAIDDILFTTTVSADDQRKLAISCKSGVQVKTSALPADFVARCWQQWEAADTGPMQRGRDCLMLVTRGRNNSFMATWSQLKDHARGTDVALAIGRMRATPKLRRMLESVEAPAKDAGLPVSDADLVAIVDSIAVVPLDFQITESEDEKSAIAQSRSLLQCNSLTEGKQLWAELVAQARKVRLGSGTLEISDLWRCLRSKFTLKDHPDYEGSWQRLRALTSDYRATIDTELRRGLTLDREDESDKLMDRVAADAVCVVFGESGSGKSALVKLTLSERVPSACQVWFGPDSLDHLLNEATRLSHGVTQPLIDVLDATAHTENFLVIDAAERVSDDCRKRTKTLIKELRNRNSTSATGRWHVLIIGQTEAWVTGSLQDLAGTESPTSFELQDLLSSTVRDTLRSVAGLEWLALDQDAVLALTNVRTLAWVIQAADQFEAKGSSIEFSPTTIVDRLWAYWTENRPSIHRLLVSLAEREALFEHSFAISQLESGDAAVLDDLPVACPLRQSAATGRIQFQHDLAADWARFVRLKEIAGDTAQWALFAGNPFWHNALRMLGQLLLRQVVDARSAWDVAFEFVEQNRTTMPLADDILLDALFLDPSAEAFLNQRADSLLSNNGARLLRLTKRFDHVASAPSGDTVAQPHFRDISLYIETHFRTPIYGRWPAMAGFLAKHRYRIAKLTSPAIASLCHRWLTSTPPVLPGGQRTPFRGEFAELALATARERQLGEAKGIIYLDDSGKSIYHAALAGAPDLPSEVSDWALEMAQRRPYRADILEQLASHRAQQVAEHRRRLEVDPEYRQRHERLRRVPSAIPSGRKLAPWPLGPTSRVDSDFRDAVLRAASIQALMRTNADVAGEVILACIIEDEPEERYDSSPSLDRELGIAFDSEGYPSAPWKSPFYAFLHIDSGKALHYLHQLVDFATARWVDAARKFSGSEPETFSFQLADGTAREIAGNYWVFTWSHQNSLFNGQLHSALAALEKWLCDLIDTRAEVVPHIDSLLRLTTSVAVLGVLTNVGKYQRDLFQGPLKPLLAIQDLYQWDCRRAQENAYGFDAMAWARDGEIVFEMAKSWALAPYRQVTLREIVPEIVLAHRDVSDFVSAATGHWVYPTSEKAIVEFRMLLAELNEQNYSRSINPDTGEEVIDFAYPADVAKAIEEFEQDHSLGLQALTFPRTCREVLNSARILNDEDATHVASLLVACGGDKAIDLEEDQLRAARTAAAALLLLRAPDWLTQNVSLGHRARSTIDEAIAQIPDRNAAGGPRISSDVGHLEFAAYVVFERWLTEPSDDNDVKILELLTSDDDGAVLVLVWSAYRNREVLGQRWWRLLFLALLWSGLSMLSPHYRDEEGTGIRWKRWCRWLRACSLSTETTLSFVNPVAVAERVERLEFRRWQRRYAQRDHFRPIRAGRRLSGGLDTHFLKIAFSWLFRAHGDHSIPPQELETHRRLVLKFWAQQAWWLSGTGKEEDDDYQSMPELGYLILDEIARLMLESPSEVGPALWRPVFALGPRGHHSLSYFLTCWFNQLTEDTAVTDFAKRWRPMIEFMLLDDQWASAGRWYHGQRLEREVLGFAAANVLERATDHVALVTGMRDLFEIWAKKRLIGDEDNLAAFCGFLTHHIGKPLRISGLQWVADAMQTGLASDNWFRDRTSTAFVDFLDVVVSEHAHQVGRDEKVWKALFALSAHAVSRQLKSALALHERIRRLKGA